jgi:hypothetical protein
MFGNEQPIEPIDNGPKFDHLAGISGYAAPLEEKPTPAPVFDEDSEATRKRRLMKKSKKRVKTKKMKYKMVFVPGGDEGSNNDVNNLLGINPLDPQLNLEDPQSVLASQLNFEDP